MATDDRAVRDAMGVRVGERFVILSRFPSPGAPKGSLVGEAEVSHSAAYDSLRRFSDGLRAIEVDDRLSEVGKGERKRELALEERRTLQRVRRRGIAPRRQAVEERRGALQPVKPDPADLAGALRRQELRSHLRGLNPDRRRALLDESKSALEAAIELPETTGVSREHAEGLRRRLIERRHPEELAEIEEEEAAVRAAEEAVANADAYLATIARGELSEDDEDGSGAGPRG